MVLNPLSIAVLLLAAAVAVTAFGEVPRSGVQPLAVLASLLPLQLAALLVVVRPALRSGLRAAEPRRPGLKPRASD